MPPRGERKSNACVDALGFNNVGANEGVIQSHVTTSESEPRVLPCLHFQSRSVSDFAAQMGNLSLDLVNGVEWRSIVMMQPSAGSYLGCENLTLEESRVKTDVRPPICFLMSKNNGEGSGIWTCERSI